MYVLRFRENTPFQSYYSGDEMFRPSILGKASGFLGYDFWSRSSNIFPDFSTQNSTPKIIVIYSHIVIYQTVATPQKNHWPPLNAWSAIAVATPKRSPPGWGEQPPVRTGPSWSNPLLSARIGQLAPSCLDSPGVINNPAASLQNRGQLPSMEAAALFSLRFFREKNRLIGSPRLLWWIEILHQLHGLKMARASGEKKTNLISAMLNTIFLS